MITFPLGRDRESCTMDEAQFSPFQVQTWREIVESSGFDFACCDLSVWSSLGETRKPGPYNFLYYTKDNHLHLQRVGVNRVLRSVTPNITSPRRYESD